MTKTDRLVLSMALSLILLMLSVTFFHFWDLCAAVRADSLRLHIVANSDTDRDQQLKLEVRDAILDEYSSLLGAGNSAQEATFLATYLSNDIALTAKKVLAREGVSCPVSVSVTEMYFDTRTYAPGVIMPAGNYHALRVVLGDGGGHNWWCVMYPPLCIPAATPSACEGIETRIRALSDAPCYEARFAIVELTERLLQAAHSAFGA
ncbi:MAG: stage II sporulation protein R [Oscillospiraceae bacterium]